MKRYGWRLVTLITLVAFVFIWLIRAPIISSYLSSRMGISVSIRWIGIWPSSSSIHNFAVKNPSGFKGDAFKAEKVVCAYHLKALFQDPTSIDQIEIRNSVLTIDFVNAAGDQNNWAALTKIVSAKKTEGNFIIKKLILDDFNVDIQGSSLFLKPRQTHFDHLEFDDIESSEGFPTKRLIKLIFETGGVQQYIQDALNPEKDLQKMLSPLSDF